MFWTQSSPESSEFFIYCPEIEWTASWDMMERTIWSVRGGVNILEYLAGWFPTLKFSRSQRKLWNNLPLIHCVNKHHQPSSCSFPGSPIAGGPCFCPAVCPSCWNPSWSLKEHLVLWHSFALWLPSLERTKSLRSFSSVERSILDALTWSTVRLCRLGDVAVADPWDSTILSAL